MPDPVFLLLILGFIFLLTVIIGYFGIRLLRREHIGQDVREEGPKSHYKKSGTPTFGGLFFLIPLFLFAILLRVLWPEFKFYALLVVGMLAFGAVGFLDDYIKVYRDKGGLKPLQKTGFMLVLSVLFTYIYMAHVPGGPIFRVPFTGRVLPVEGLGWQIFYGIFVVVYLYFTINAANLTDGIDGLMASVTTASTLGIALIALKLRDELEFATPLMYLALSITAGMLGFFVWNRHPAKVFMGDTGSLAVGAGLSLLCLYLGMPWVFLLVGFIYCLEAVSVILQVGYFKATGGKRIFKMTPIHHHFELSGWSEWKIDGVFALITIILSIAAYFIV